MKPYVYRPLQNALNSTRLLQILPDVIPMVAQFYRDSSLDSPRCRKKHMLVAREKHGADAGFHGRIQGSKQQPEDKRTSLMGHRARLHVRERKRKSQRPPGEGFKPVRASENPDSE
jgi:hypothetical protein